MPYVEAGAEVSRVPDLLPYGFTNAKVEKRVPVKVRQKHGWTALLRRSKEVPYLNLFDVTVFRIAPYVAKAHFLYAKIRNDPMSGKDESNFRYEHAMYPRLCFLDHFFDDSIIVCCQTNIKLKMCKMAHYYLTCALRHIIMLDVTDEL